jgi:aminopeptidase N
MKKKIPFLVSGFWFLVIYIMIATSCNAQPLSTDHPFTHADTLRGTITPERAWWDVMRYDINVTPDYAMKSIKATTLISFRINSRQHTNYLQIDLQQPMMIDSVVFDKNKFPVPANSISREGNVYHVLTPGFDDTGKHTALVYYHGTPRAAKTPPWDGGWIWSKDKQGRPWMSVACQGLGASVWYPCKDHQSDEPDQGASLTINVPDSLVAVANGRMTSKSVNNGIATYKWEVVNPINNYDIIPYIGKYVNFSDTAMGEKGKLDLNYWVLDYNLAKAKEQFKQVKPMIRAFEYWFGPYPFYEDGYKLVEAPHLGMEHQSAVAYGNKYMNGYLGRDLSGTGQGLKWDYIIVHESGHEWFGNNITTKDIADMWVHEGFTDYSETLFIEYHYGKAAADQYVQGLRKNIDNQRNIIGAYGVNKEGSDDMYYKGANLLHTIRQVINDDEKFRRILRGLNKDFYHKTVTSAEVESYISKKSGIDFSKVFDQYLRTTKIPELQLRADGDKLKFQWNNVVDGFAMPVRLTNGLWIKPTTEEQKMKIKNTNFDKLTVDKNFYVNVVSR